jgi:hypothetical protein
MLNVVSKKCIHIECSVLPSYNYPGEKTAIYCAKHKLDDMINIKSKTCIYEGCNIQPSCNYLGEKTAIYCATHKLYDMVNIKDKKCIFEGCNVQPSCNFPGEKTPIYCVTHKLDDMINVVSKTCIYEGCIIIPIFNYPGEKIALYCVTHKLDDMVNVVSKRCIYEGCNILSSYNLTGEKTALYCLIHKNDKMVNIKHKSCTNCGLSYSKLFDNLCVDCNPEKQKLKIRKEQIISDVLEEKFPNYKFIRDKSSPYIKICTGKYIRPDFVLILDERAIIIEVDEHQHESYPENCEVTRFVNISMSYGGSPVIWIRYNPDSFKINEESQNVSPKMRLNQLVELIQKYVDLSFEELKKLIIVEYLFYDDDRQQRLEELTESYMKNYK